MTIEPTESNDESGIEPTESSDDNHTPSNAETKPPTNQTTHTHSSKSKLHTFQDRNKTSILFPSQQANRKPNTRPIQKTNFAR
jgi:hypothetical protein